jgi:hypothetical protein
MCKRIWGAPDLKHGYIGSPSELGAIVGGRDNLVYHDSGWNIPIPEVYWHDWTKDGCLCGVDIRQTLTDAGIPWEEDECVGDINLVDQEPAP